MPLWTGLWFVLSGQAQFYGTKKDVMIAKLGPHQGIFIARDFPYWFETMGDDRLELLQVEAIDRTEKNTRTDYKKQKQSANDVLMFDTDGTPMPKVKFRPGLEDHE